MSSLTTLFTNIANAIRTKKGTSASITASDFPSEISSIPTGITPTGTIPITTNGTVDVTNYVNADVSVQPNLQSISQTITTNNTTTTFTPDTGYDGLSSVAITTNVPSGGSFTIDDASFLFYQKARLDIMSDLLLQCGQVTSCQSMFYGCNTLQNLDLSSLDTRNCTNMNSMFMSIKSSVTGTGLQSLTLGSNFDTSNVTTMYGMFNKAFHPYIDTSFITTLVTTNVTDMGYMFNGSMHRSLDISDFNTQNVTSFDSCLADCSNLTTLDIGNLDCGKVVKIYRFMYRIATLTSFNGIFKDLGKAYTSTSNNYSNYQLDISNTGFTHDNLVAIIGGLYDLNVTYNVAGGGTLHTQSLNVGSTNLAKLSADEIAVATAKGWTVS